MSARTNTALLIIGSLALSVPALAAPKADRGNPDAPGRAVAAERHERNDAREAERAAAPSGRERAPASPGRSAGAPGREHSADAPGRSGSPGRSDSAHGRSDSAPGRSDSGPGRSDDRAPTPRGDDPPGVANSGTIKISTWSEPPSPSNNPHPGCGFRVDWYGFRTGTFDVTISTHPPTGRDVLVTDVVVIATREQGNTLQVMRSYDVRPLLPPSDDGRWHIRVEAERRDMPGNGAKTKMLWLECPVEEAPDVQPTPVPAPPPVAPDRGAGPVVVPVAPVAGPPEVPAAPAPVAGAPVAPVAPIAPGALAGDFAAGGAPAGPAAVAQAPTEDLATTGGGWRRLLILAVLLFTFGTVALILSRPAPVR